MSSLSITSSAQSSLASAGALDPIADFQKLRDNLPKYSKGSIEVTRTLIVHKMKACIDSMPGVTTMDSKIGIRSSILGQYDATIISPGSIIAKAKIVNTHDLQEQDGVVFLDSKRIRIFNLSDNKLIYIEIKDWCIGGEVFSGEVISRPYSNIFHNVYAHDLNKENLKDAEHVMQIFINRLLEAKKFIAEKGLAKATIPSSRREIKAIIMTALSSFLTRDPAGIVVNYALDEDLKPCLLDLPSG